jgi:hypothetical protein
VPESTLAGFNLSECQIAPHMAQNYKSLIFELKNLT